MSCYSTSHKILLDFGVRFLYILMMQYKKAPWTYEERVILKKHYKKVPMSELLVLLPGRSESAIYSQVNYLRKRKWSFY